MRVHASDPESIYRYGSTLCGVRTGTVASRAQDVTCPKCRAIARRRASTPDIRIEHHGSIVLLRPVSANGTEWLAEHLPEDAQNWGEAKVCEPRYVQPILDGMMHDGLVVQA